MLSDSPNGETGKSDKFLVRRARMERATSPSRMITTKAARMATITTHAWTPLGADAAAVFEDTSAVAPGEGLASKEE